MHTRQCLIGHSVTGDGWHDADPDDVTEAMHYALRFRLAGKAHGKLAATDDEVMARAVVQHLLRANYRSLQGPPRPPHSTGDFGQNPGVLSCWGILDIPPPMGLSMNYVCLERLNASYCYRVRERRIRQFNRGKACSPAIATAVRPT